MSAATMHTKRNSAHAHGSHTHTARTHDTHAHAPHVTSTPIAPDLAQSIDAACARIAPAWPLDRMIAVNPFWGWVQHPITHAAAQVGALQGATMLMPRQWYREQVDAGRVTEQHIASAIQATGARRSTHDVLSTLHREEHAPAPWRLMTDAADTGRDLHHAMPWTEYVTRHVSQACAAFYDDDQAGWVPDRSRGLYPLWHTLASHDGGPRLLMRLHGFRAAVAALQLDPRAVIAESLEELCIDRDVRDQYLTALLLSINGWASACAFRRWDARLAGGDDDGIVHLLAIRLAWELLLHRLGTPQARDAWRTAQSEWRSVLSAAHASHTDDWLLQRACEVAYQEELTSALTAPRTASAPTSPHAQAVFCIDVRSEPFRRHLEDVAPTIQTLGFAGFFGLALAYQPAHGPARPQLPGLLAPSLTATDSGDSAYLSSRTNSLRVGDSAYSSTNDGDAALLSSLGSTAGSAFSFVEATGLSALAKLVRDGLALGAPSGDPLRPKAAMMPRAEVVQRADGTPVTLQARVALAAGILRAMSLTHDFAPILALIGHGASTENNPLAAGLHCGACGGQTGEVNARALAALLNDTEVRAGLKALDIDLGETLVLAGLHDTTTDDVTLYDLDVAPPSFRDRITALQQQFASAGAHTRCERAAALGLHGVPGPDLDRTIRQRARDWAEVRPEWGLANNAAFIVAPRARTRDLDLRGRSFLHEYDWREDATFGVLELIMTAPMVVTHWINLQYHASVVDPLRYGSGNKVLHNVVGGRIGVMEGAGGDLRTGLAWQSVHDGTRFMHDPLRLSVFIEAPPGAIDAVLAKHDTVRALVANEWLFLHCIDPATGAVSRRSVSGWTRVR